MISIIIPAYNAQAFLEQCIASIRAQEGLDAGMEIIIVDDGSTDATAAIADRIAAEDSRVQVIHTPNRGPSQARNTALDIARGQYICFVDADDILLPEALKSMRQNIVSYRADVIVASMTTGNHLPGTIRITKPRTQIVNGFAAVERMLYQNNFSSAPWAKLYRRDCIADKRFSPGIFYEDLEFNYRLLCTCQRVALMPRNVYFYRQHPDSALHRWSQARLDVLHVTNYIETSVADIAPTLRPAAADRKLSANFNIFITASRAGLDDVAQQCWLTIKDYRGRSMRNRAVRLKNKVGILLSYLGPWAVKLASRLTH